MRDNLARLPCRQAAAYEMCFYVGWQMGGSPNDAGYSAKERDCLRNVRCRRIPVTIPSSACSFDELRCYGQIVRRRLTDGQVRRKARSQAIVVEGLRKLC